MARSDIALPKKGLLFVTGNSWSGKTAFTSQLLNSFASTTWISTLTRQEEKLTEIIKHQRKQRTPSWRELDGSINLIEIIESQSAESSPLVVDSCNLWFGNIAAESVQKHTPEQLRSVLDDQLSALIESLAFQAKHRLMVAVSSDLGAGLAPQDAYSFEVRRIVSLCNQVLGSHAVAAINVVSGIGVILK